MTTLHENKLSLIFMDLRIFLVIFIEAFKIAENHEKQGFTFLLPFCLHISAFQALSHLANASG